MRVCFNPRICKRCDNIEGTSARETAVSIHASVKDATHKAEILSNPSLVSIHASVKDATPAMLAKLAGGMFQSTHL